MIKVNDVTFYTSNTIRSLSNFDTYYLATQSANGYTIAPNGYMEYNLSNDYCSGLNSSLYRYIKATVECVMQNNFSYSPKIVFRLVGVYTLAGLENKVDITIALCKDNSTVDSNNSNLWYMDGYVQMPYYDFSSLKLVIENNTNSNIDVRTVEMYRSVDIPISQLSDAVKTAITLKRTLWYTDGMTAEFENDATILKLWWLEDGNDQLAGINVNNERVVEIGRRNMALEN